MFGANGNGHAVDGASAPSSPSPSPSPPPPGPPPHWTADAAPSLGTPDTQEDEQAQNAQQQRQHQQWSHAPALASSSSVLSPPPPSLSPGGVAAALAAPGSTDSALVRLRRSSLASRISLPLGGASPRSRVQLHAPAAAAGQARSPPPGVAARSVMTGARDPQPRGATGQPQPPPPPPVSRSVEMTDLQRMPRDTTHNPPGQATTTESETHDEQHGDDEPEGRGSRATKSDRDDEHDADSDAAAAAALSSLNRPGSVFPLAASAATDVPPDSSSASSFDSADELRYPLSCLPAAFTGARGLVMPPMLRGDLANITLPSRLALLGRNSFRIAAAIMPHYIGNVVLGFAPVGCSVRSRARQPASLYILPWLFSKGAARMSLFVRVLALLLLSLLVVDFFNLATVNVGRVWIIGLGCSLAVMLALSLLRRAPEGLMPFCRSIGQPRMEEVMFSYAWKHQPEDIRTIAKAMWNAGVGVWIDVLKLTPGDAIRPLVRTIAARVSRVVIFLSPAYCASPNCMVEFAQAMQRPSRCLVCIVQAVDPSVEQFLHRHGMEVCFGLTELMRKLDRMVSAADPEDFAWWQAQSISGAGVPDHATPSDQWPIPRYTLHGRVLLPMHSLTVGCVYLSGDCRTSGTRLSPPWLLLVALVGIGVNVWDLVDKLTAAGNTGRGALDFLWLGALCLCTLFPFFAAPLSLLETRVGPGVSVCLRPLLTSKVLRGGGVRIRVVGASTSSVAHALRQFIKSIGHDPQNEPEYTVEQFCTETGAKQKASTSRSSTDDKEERKSERMQSRSPPPPHSSSHPDALQLSPLSVAVSVDPPAGDGSLAGPVRPSSSFDGGSASGSASSPSDHVVTLFIMRALELIIMADRELELEI